MSNFSGDRAGFSAVLTPTTLDTNTVAWSTAIDVWGYDALDTRLYLTNLGTSLTQVQGQFQWSDDLVSPTHWVDVYSEAIAAGVGTEMIYKPQPPVFAAAPVSVGLRCRAMGRWMRVGWLAIAGNPVGSVATCTAIRR